MVMRLHKCVKLFAYYNSISINKEAKEFVLNSSISVLLRSLILGKLLLVQIAKNKFILKRDIRIVKRDYVFYIKLLGRYANVLVINISSLNMLSLRNLQAVSLFTKLLSRVVDTVRKIEQKAWLRVMVKVSLDKDDDLQMCSIVKAI
jgi:dihydroorotate dehydrogenase